MWINEVFLILVLIWVAHGCILPLVQMKNVSILANSFATMLFFMFERKCSSHSFSSVFHPVSDFWLVSHHAHLEWRSNQDLLVPLGNEIKRKSFKFILFSTFSGQESAFLSSAWVGWIVFCFFFVRLRIITRVSKHRQMTVRLPSTHSPPSLSLMKTASPVCLCARVKKEHDYWCEGKGLVGGAGGCCCAVFVGDNRPVLNERGMWNISGREGENDERDGRRPAPVSFFLFTSLLRGRLMESNEWYDRRYWQA